VIEGSGHLSRAPYLVAFASDAALPPLPNSVYVYRADLDTDPRVRLEAELGRLAAERDTAEAVVRAEAAEARIAAAEERVVAAVARAAEGAEREANAARMIGELQQASEAAAAELRRMSDAAATEAQRAAALAAVRLARSERRTEAAEQRAAAAEAELERYRQQGMALQGQLAQAEARAAQIEHELGETVHRLATEMTGHYQAQQQAQLAAQRLAEIEASSAWRSTRPLRHAGQRFPRLARSLRRGAQVAWWTGTFQVHRRYRMWRGNQQQRLVPGPALPHIPAPEPVAELPAPPPQAIRIESSREPDVSIVISTYGQLGVTLGCLRSIAAHAPRCSIEVIVVDDAYPGPEDMGALRDVVGIQLVRNAANLGFLLSCNLAARAAKGRYIYMLNNDTELQPGSIDALVELLDARPDAGMAGSKLLFPDGRLQEAGGILWNDASGWNYGRGGDPARPEYNYVREVDYCSGASIMVRRALFQSVGGFDEEFAPAYYEDADLAFRLRARRMRVLYEPRSLVVHHEGMSHGTDLASGVKAHQVKNQARMMERWGGVLARENYPSGQHVLRARDRARTRRVILVIDHYVPEPDRDAGSRSAMGIIDSLIDAGWVVKFWPQNRLYSPVYTSALERRGIEVLDHRWPGDLGAWMRESGGELDHLLVIRPDVAAEMLPHLLRNTDAVLSMYGVDLHFARMRRQAALDPDPKLLQAAEAMERLERRIWRHFDLVIYPSEEEAAVVRSMAPHTLARGIVPFCFDAFPARGAPPEGHSILFVAGFAHPPNVDAAMFLVHQVVPQLEQEIGPVKVVLAGSNPTEAVRALAGLDVEVTGYVTDETLGALYDRHRVSVVPLRFGAGVKGKVVESLSRGLPLVTTSIGAQGIAGLGDVVPVHDDVPGIVAALRLLLTDDAAWKAQSAAQMAFAQRCFSRAAMQRSVLSAFEAGEAARPAAQGHQGSELPIAGVGTQLQSDASSIEIDRTFSSLKDWTAWVSENGGVLSRTEADRIGKRILEAGFVEPLTGTVISPAEIEQCGRNWREGLRAKGLSSRMRAVLSIIDEKVGVCSPQEVRIFAAEAVTAFALRLRGHFVRFHGAEYGADERAQRALFPIRHEDLTALTLPSGSFDLVTTNEVLEHVPDLDAALREIARVLKPGGWHVGTHPFLFTSERGDRRSELVDGEIAYHKEPEYHHDPVVNNAGSLVFETPGWDILERARVAGFSDAHMRFVASEQHGYVTEDIGVFVFCAQK
jgi:GT2 family glycosyltransferase/glycosyltransferase involved in cell wall biosynthesis/SAM-dependent methyltransferase